MSIGEVICEVRESRGMTQSELADRVMVTRQAVSRWRPAPPPLALTCVSSWRLRLTFR